MLRSIIRRGFITLVAMLSLVVSGASGTPITTYTNTLDKLLWSPGNPKSVTVGDKKFSGFKFSAGDCAPFTASGIDVTIKTTNGIDYSVKFDLNSKSLKSKSGGLEIDYRVDVLDPNLVIAAVGLNIAGSCDPTANDNSLSLTNGSTQYSTKKSSIWATKTVKSTDGSDVEPGQPISDTKVLSVYNDGFGGLADNLHDAMIVADQRSLAIADKVYLTSGMRDYSATVVSIENTFHQADPSVPEPATIGSLTVGAMMFLARRRSK